MGRTVLTVKSCDAVTAAQDKLKELGGVYEAAASLWAPHVVRDGRLVTGQNPASSHAVAEQIVAALA